jgi:DNA mismatch repair protein MutS
MMQQYREAKDRHPGMLLLFRMGDFYELFDSDAETAARVLGLTLTSRDKSVAMAGFPHHSLEPYLRKLLQAGHRVAICDQVEDPALAKGLVRREVTRVVTPGTLTEDELLDPRQSNYLAAVHIPSSRTAVRRVQDLIGLAWVDLSTGHFQATDVSMSQLKDELGRLAPAECLVAESDIGRFHFDEPSFTLTSRPDWNFDPPSAQSILHEHFSVSTLTGFGFEDSQPCLVSAGALLTYLRETLKAGLTHIGRLHLYRQSSHLLVDEVTRRSLELTHTIRDGSRDGSLLSALDRSVTAMGARLLQEWLLTPLAELPAIESRLEAVAELAEDHALRRDLRDALRDSFDLQRLTSRASTGRASPRDLAAIGATLRLLPRVKAKVTARRASLLCELEARLELCPDLRQMLEAALVDNPPLSPREGGVIRPGYDSQLDEIRGVAKSGKEWIANFQADEISRTGINSLKVGFNRVFGYYIEITNTHAQKIPADYQRKQTLKNAERYITPALKEYEGKVLTAEEKIFKREYELFVSIRDRVAAETHRLLQAGEVLATLDVLASLAELAASRQYCRPELCQDSILSIQAGRHPVLNQTLPAGTFVPNDVDLKPEEGMLWLVTGPNMAGKSTYIRQVALLTLMTHIGSFVPARQARIGIVDRIFTRVGASDDLSRGRSTFMVEMTEAANILNNATDRSLVILDEIGRGTSTYDGVSLAWAITEYLHDQVGCRTLFATHYHELAQLSNKLPGLRNYNVQVQECEGRVVFLHQIAAGSADKSYGIHVAKLAGVPEEVLERANEVLADLEAHQVKTRRLGAPVIRKRKAPAQHPTFFADMEPRKEREIRNAGTQEK